MKIGNLSLLKLLGKGTMGEVYLSTKKDSKELYATKKLDKKTADRPQVKKYFINEIKILRELKHNKIIRLIDLKQTPSHYYIVMEYCNGGSLLTCLRKYKELYKKSFSEEIVQFLMRQIVRGLKYIHDHKIVHRDIKLDNILVKFYAEDDLKNLNMMKTHIKISDFGISIYLDDNDLAYTALGSPAYMDPFILKKLNERNDLLNSQGYDQSADIWSLGAMCYEMLIGRRVFTGRNIKDLFKKVEDGNYSLPTHLSKEVVSFINGMLQYDSKKRLTCEELSRHQFLTRNVKDFTAIDFALVRNKLGENGINFNTKNNQTLWYVFNEETEVKLNSIPTRILDDNALPENQDNLFNVSPNINKKNQQNQQHQNYNQFNNVINEQNFQSNNNANINVISNTNNYNVDIKSKNMDKLSKVNYNNNYTKTQLQYNPQSINNYNNTFDNINMNYNFNNMGNTANTINPYQTGAYNVNSQNVNVPFYEGRTMNPQMNNNITTQMNNNINTQINNNITTEFNNNNNNSNQNNNIPSQMNPNYPGDIKIKKEIAVTDESCLHQ